MAGPLAGAGAVSVALLSSARAILGPKKTAEFAIKGSKFLSNQVEKARKLLNKPTAGQIKAEVPTKGTRAYAKGQAKAIAGTGAVGAAAYASKDSVPKRKPKTSSMTTKGTSENPKSRGMSEKKPKSRNTVKDKPKASASKQVNPKDFPTYKKDTKSAGSFRAATTAAKKAGKKTFTWEGRKYSTKEK